MGTEQQLRENTAINNGMSEAAIAEIKARQDVKDGNSWSLSPSQEIVNNAIFNRVTAVKEFYIVVKGKPILVPAGTTVSPFRMNKTRTLYKARIIGVDGLDDMQLYVMPISYTGTDGLEHSYVIWPGKESKNAASGEKRESTPKRVVDAVEQAMIDAYNTCGERKPMKYDPKDKTKVTDWGHYGKGVADWSTADWRKAFPGYTPTNLRVAFQKISAFRANRQAVMDAATTDEAIMDAVEDYRRAKSYEQELCSVAGKCGLI